MSEHAEVPVSVPGGAPNVSPQYLQALQRTVQEAVLRHAVVMQSARPTLAHIKLNWPPTVDVKQAALALGVSRSSLYEAIRSGQCPVKTIKVNHRIVVLTADLIRVLEGK